MRRILFVFIPLCLVAFMCIFSQFSLKGFVKTSDEDLVTSLDLGFILEETLNNNYKLYKDGEKVVGECVTLNGLKTNINEIASKIGFMLTNKYVVNETCVYEGVSPKLKYSISGRQANVQIAVSQGEIIIASPIIYGSF